MKVDSFVKSVNVFTGTKNQGCTRERECGQETGHRAAKALGTYPVSNTAMGVREPFTLDLDKESGTPFTSTLRNSSL